MKSRPNIEELSLMLSDCMQRLQGLEAETAELRKENAELRKENVELRKENAELRKENVELRKENAELRKRLGMNSKNSHKPPSSDGPKKPKIESQLPKMEGRPAGGQKGHKGDTLKMADKPDAIEKHVPSECDCCRRKFRESELSLLERRQVYDLPPELRLHVTEHQVLGTECCGRVHRGKFPEGVSAPVQYGEKVQSFAVMLNVDYKLPYERISRLASDIFGSSLNEGTVVDACERMYVKLQPVEERIKDRLLAGEVAHFDESGVRAGGNNRWLHTVSSALFCYLFVHSQRGVKALSDESCSLLPKFKGWAVHDCWASYFHFEQANHALCGAHLLRELRALVEDGSLWAACMYRFLYVLYLLCERGTAAINSPEEWSAKYDEICLMADKEEPPPAKKNRGKPKRTKGRCLLDRLVKHKQGVLAFAFEPNVPFTNNIAERDIRCVKVKQKVSGGFRTFKGAQVYARIQGVVKTLRKHGLNVFQSLIDVFTNKQESLQF